MSATKKPDWWPKPVKPYYFKAKFTSVKGKTITVRYRGDRERPEFVRRKGVKYFYDYDATFERGRFAAARLGGRNTDTSVCEALSVIPSQRAEAIADGVRRGLKGFHFNEEGTLSFESDRARREYYKEYGYFDKNAGYRGVTPEQMREYQAARRN